MHVWFQHIWHTGFFFVSRVAPFFYPFCLVPSPCTCLLLPVRTYCFSAWQSLGLTKGWRAVEGVILWASVARLAANHLYEHTGGQREPHDFSLTCTEEMSEAHPDHTNSEWFTDCSDIDPHCGYSQWGRWTQTEHILLFSISVLLFSVSFICLLKVPLVKSCFVLNFIDVVLPIYNLPDTISHMGSQAPFSHPSDMRESWDCAWMCWCLQVSTSAWQMCVISNQYTGKSQIINSYVLWG